MDNMSLFIVTQCIFTCELIDILCTMTEIKDCWFIFSIFVYPHVHLPPSVAYRAENIEIYTTEIQITDHR